MSLDPLQFRVVASNHTERSSYDPVFDPALLQGFTAINNSKNSTNAALDHAALAGLSHHDAYAHTELAHNKDSDTKFPVSGKTPFKVFINPDNIRS